MNLDYDVAVCSATTDDGWYGIQAKGFGGDKAGIGFDSYQPQFGFASRPLDATIEADGTPVGCLMFKAETGTKGGFAWFGHDVRFTAKAPPITRGSCAQWNAKGAFSLLDYETDTWTLYVPIKGGTKAHKIYAGEDGAGKPTIDFLHSSGAYQTFTDSSVVVRHTGNALIEVKPAEITIQGAINAPTSLSVGGAAAQPLVNGTAFQLTLAAMATALSNLTPITPYEIGLHAALLALVSAFSSCQTTALKGI